MVLIQAMLIFYVKNMWCNGANAGDADISWVYLACEKHNLNNKNAWSDKNAHCLGVSDNV